MSNTAINSINLRAYAKVNLCLDVIGKRSDGYHDIVSVMQSVSLHDSIFLKKVYKDNYLKVVTDVWFLPVDGKNIIHKAISALLERYSLPSGVFVQLNKSIPISAGLGGGSSDCASVLMGMKALFDLPISREELMDIGKSLGADVPFFFVKGTALAKGIGDILTPLPSLPPCTFVLIRPPIFISTADVFKKFKPENVKQHADEEKMIYCLRNQDLKGVCENMVNSLETVTSAGHPIIEELKQELLYHGALGALMSGSGPTVFGCFDHKHTAQQAFAAIKKNHPDIKEIFLIKSN